MMPIGGRAALVIAVGIASALHVGKLPPAIPVLRNDLGVSLVQGGFLLSLVQLAGMLLGAAVGMLADRLGARRVMLAGLLLLALASGLGAGAPSVALLLITRGLEGLGFLLAVLPAPGLLRRLVHEPKALNTALGFWGAYMPLGAATALLLGPMVYAAWGWRLGWWVLAVLSAVFAWLVWRHVPADPEVAAGCQPQPMPQRLRLTLTSRGPWLVALGFLMYSGQWLAVVGFLPTIYTQAGWSAAAVGGMSALAAGVNMTGNVVVGRLLGRGVAPATLLAVGYAAMAVGAFVTFNAAVPAWGQFVAVLAFSAVGGLIPGTLFGLAVRLAPSQQTVSTTVGWVQQLSSLGQFVGPPLVAWLAARVGGWQQTWWITGACCLTGLGLAWCLQQQLRRLHHI
jgi:MFS family permease